MGQIIPVDEQHKAIVNAAHPHYRRDPQDPAKALPTPAPKVTNYQVAKNAQNYHRQTNLVDPPKDPSQNTYLFYSERPSSNINARSARISKATKRNYHSVSSKRFVQSNQHQQQRSVVAIQPKQTASQYHVINSQTPRENPAATRRQVLTNNYSSYSSLRPSSEQESEASQVRLFGFRKKKNKKQSEQHSKKKASKSKKTVTLTSNNKKNRPTAKKKPKKTGSPLQRFEKPQAILNEELKIPPKPLKAELKIIDLDAANKVLATLKTEGKIGHAIIFKDLKEQVAAKLNKHYLVNNLTNETDQKKVKITDLNHLSLGYFGEQDLKFALTLRHQKIALTSQNITHYDLPLKTVAFKTSLTVNFTGAVSKTPDPIVKTANWKRQLTWDLVTKKIVPGKFDLAWSCTPEKYPEVQIPQVAGYHTDLKQVGPIKVEKQSVERTIIYEQNKQKVASVQTTELAMPEVQEPEFRKVDADHPNYLITPNNYLKTVHFTVVCENSDHQILNKQVQTVQMKRSVTIDPKYHLVPNGQYTSNWHAAKKNYQDVELVSVPGYESEQTVVKGPQIVAHDLTQTVIYHKLAKKTAAQITANSRIFTQTIHFVDENQQQLLPDHQEKLVFTPTKDGWNKKIASFVSVTVPLVKGMYADLKRIKGKSVMPDDKKRNLEVTVKYHPFGKIIPIDKDGVMITGENDQDLAQTFVNDSEDATKAASEQKVPEIKGWQTKVKTVTPVDPAINIPVLYQAVDPADGVDMEQ